MNQFREDTRSLPTVALHTSIWALTIVLTLTGNVLLCLAFYRNRRLRTVTNFYIFSLAVTDIVVATFEYPFNMIASGARHWPFGFVFCQLNGFLSYFWAFTSICILALTAVNRYFCIVKARSYSALFTKKKTVFSILFVWIYVFSVNLMSTLVTPVLYQWHSGYLFCEATKGRQTGDRKVLTFTFITAFFLFPMLIILFCYGSVYRAIRRHNSAVIPTLQEASTQGHLHNQGMVSVQEIQASRVLLAAVVAFLVSWSSISVVKIAQGVIGLSVPSFWHSFAVLSSACSSWINPIIYGVLNRAMRNEFLNFLRFQKWEWHFRFLTAGILWKKIPPTDECCENSLTCFCVI